LRGGEDLDGKTTVGSVCGGTDAFSRVGDSRSFIALKGFSTR
jgi:hypothetical protein